MSYQGYVFLSHELSNATPLTVVERKGSTKLLHGSGGEHWKLQSSLLFLLSATWCHSWELVLLWWCSSLPEPCASLLMEGLILLDQVSLEDSAVEHSSLYHWALIFRPYTIIPRLPSGLKKAVESTASPSLQKDAFLYLHRSPCLQG